MKKAGSYTSLIDQLKQLEYHLDNMIDIIETYSSALLHLNVQEIERITDEYHRASLKYSSLQKDLAQVLANLHSELYVQTGNNGMESNNSVGVSDDEITAMTVLRHSGIVFAFNSAVWEKFHLGELVSFNDNKTGRPALRNTVYEPQEGDMPLPSSMAVAEGGPSRSASWSSASARSPRSPAPSGCWWGGCDAAVAIRSTR
jgi:hypothetical protein